MNRIVLAILLLTAGLAGCIGGDDADPANVEPVNATDASADANITTGPDAVIAFIDNGIIPYHEDFRINASRAEDHPSTYLPGYPENATALNLTFDHDSLEEAVEADCEAWSQVEKETLYWVPGTRIVGLTRPTTNGSSFEFSCEDAGDALPPFIAGGAAYHGTMVASRGAGDAYGACPDCLIVSVKRHGFSAQAGPDVLWTADQPWIDIQSNSWGPSQRPCPEQFAGCARPSFADAVEDAASRQPAFWGTGNGIQNTGFVGKPSQIDPRLTPSAIRVAGHDNGNVILWTDSSPHLVSDACRGWEAVHESLDERDTTAMGGSAATPYAAGIAGKILLEARGILQDNRTGVRDGVLAKGQAAGIETGPLADGTLTMDELQRVLLTTADPRPEEIEADGERCEVGSGWPGTSTLPVPYSEVPEGPAAIPLVGYGTPTPATAQHAFQVLRGDEPMPDRSQEDAFFEADRTYRDTFHEAYTESGGQALEVDR